MRWITVGPRSLRAVAIVLCCVAGACKDDGGGSGAGACTAPAACGGDVQGLWSFESICLENAADIAGMQVDEPACSNLIVGIDVDVFGTMTFDGANATTDAEMTLDMHAVWTKACIEAVAGISNVDVAATCANLDMEYGTNPAFTGGSCSVAGQTCDCTVSITRDMSAVYGYTLDGSEIVEPDGERSSYCVEGETMSMSQDGNQLTLRR